MLPDCSWESCACRESADVGVMGAIVRPEDEGSPFSPILYTYRTAMAQGSGAMRNCTGGGSQNMWC